MALIIPSKRWGWEKPPPGTQINWGDPLADGLVSAMLFADQGGQNLLDSASRKLATTQNSPLWTPARMPLGNSLGFVGASLQGVSLGTPTELTSISTRITVLVGLIMNAADVTANNNNNPVIAAQDIDTTGTRHISWALDVNGGNQVRWYLNGSSVLTSATMVGGVPQIVGGTFNSTSGLMALYQNGIQKATTAGPVAIPANLTTPITYGFRNWSPNAYMANNGNAGYWGGQIGFAYIWARELKPADMRDLYVEPYRLFVPQSPVRRFWAIKVPATRSISETALTADTLSTHSVLFRPLAEGAATADTLAGHSTFHRSLADAAATADTLSTHYVVDRVLAETALTGDVLSGPVFRTLSETALTDDTARAGSAKSSSVAETALTADTLTAGLRLPRTLAEGALTTDSVSRALHLFRTLAESAVTVDTLIAEFPGAVNETAFTTDSLSFSFVGTRGIAETAFTTDSISGFEVFDCKFTASVVVAPSVYAYTTFPPPLPVPGPSGLHDYEVIVCDKWGIAYGQIVSAVPTQIDWVLNDLGQALIDFYILDPSASILPLNVLPGAREIQIWRDNVLIWWGWPTSCTYDAKQVHLTCAGLLFPFSKRNFGPVTTNYLQNPDFELPATLNMVPLWDTVGVTGNVTPSNGDASVLLHNFMAQLQQAVPGVDTYLRQYVPFTSSPIGDNFDLSAWVYISPNSTFAPAFGQNGLFMQWIVDDTVEVGPEIQQITVDTGAGTWTRLDCQLEVPPNQTGVLEVRLYAPQGVTYWDACNLTIPESVGSPPEGADVQFICEQILQYAQNPMEGKSDLAMPFAGPPTGVDLVRDYQLSDNSGILDALNEFPTIGVCDFEVVFDSTGHFRQFQIFPPAKGSIKYNAPLEIDLGAVTDLEGGIDGTAVITAATILGQGSSGSSKDVGYAAFPCSLGGRAVEDGFIAQGSNEISSATIAFTADDVGQGIYCRQAGVLPIGATIDSVIDSSHCTFTSNQAGGAILSVGPAVIGVGGIILDDVQSALSDLPIGTLQGTAETTIERSSQTQFLPTTRQRADGPDGLFGVIFTGDVVPASMDYGWLQIDPVLMRIATLTLYPPTEELEAQLNPVPIGENAYG